MAQTRTGATLPDSFDLQIDAAIAAAAIAAGTDTAGVGMASCADGVADGVPDEFVGIGGNIFCGTILAATNADTTAGVITCKYRYVP